MVNLSAGYGRAVGYESNSVSLSNPGIDIHTINFNQRGSDVFVKIDMGYRIPVREKEEKEN